MSSAVEHFSHPRHPLILKENDVIADDATCNVCNKTVIGSPMYTCTSPDVQCQNFYLHKTCAELPRQMNYHKHNLHSLDLLPRDDSYCDVCRQVVEFAYACDTCEFDVCVFCAFEQRVLQHEGHQEHPLTLMKREAFFECDACYEKATDSSYVCTICDFWIHKSCAFSPLIISEPTYHHHPLNLIYSIPDIHRYFYRYCGICRKKVEISNWLYYCHKCTYFVHMKCATSSVSMINEIEADDIDEETDLVQFPLPSEESLYDLIITQCSKLQVNFQGEDQNSISISTVPNDPEIIKGHWSHKDHPLERLHITTSENDNDNHDERRELTCDGCIQPITDSHPSYYACILCGFFLHHFCATKLPQQLRVGASPFHPQHLLLLEKTYRCYNFVACGVCSHSTNGFYYQCETCDTKIDIRCAFLPTRIKHKSHKHHSLVQRPFSNSRCSVSNALINRRGMEYACEICTGFQINMNCIFFPSRMRHRYDDHLMTLRQPPFFYEGVFYCEICEEQVNNQWWLYHCVECDHSFHCTCLGPYKNIKLGGTIKHTISNQVHTLTLVMRKTKRKNSTPYFCDICEQGYTLQYFLECDGCGYLACVFCVRTKWTM